MGTNRYAYAGNDPVNKADRNGHQEAESGFHESNKSAIDNGQTEVVPGTRDGIMAVSSALPGMSFAPAIEAARAGNVKGAVTHGALGLLEIGALGLGKALGFGGKLAAEIGGSTALEAGALRGITKAEQLATNKANGKLGETVAEKYLGDSILGKQVSFKTSTGKTAVADFVTKDLTVIETKTGMANLSPAQRDLLADIVAGRPVTPVGKNAAKANFEVGTPTILNGFAVNKPF